MSRRTLRKPVTSEARAEARALSAGQVEYVREAWLGTARSDQCDPKAPLWLVMGGRGSGKTRTGAEWVHEQVRRGARRIALVAPTLHAAREVMLGGDSGLLSLGPVRLRPHYMPTRRQLRFPNGAVAELFSAFDPDSLRGPQFDCAWGDEFCAWSDAEATLSNLRLALRLGTDPRLCLTTTPRPMKLLDRLIAEAGTHVTHSRTHDNADHLAPGFIARMEESYGGTELGRQELDGRILRDHPGAIFTRDRIDAHRVAEAPTLDRVIVALDPPATSGAKSDACGLVVVGVAERDGEPHAYVLHDGTVERAAPDEWAKRAVALYQHYEADCILAETNQGGEMIGAMLRGEDADVPVIGRHAARSKSARAMPVGLLYARGRVHHVGRLDALEDELCAFGGPHQSGSPDRMDALVWAVSELLSRRAGPRLSFF